MLYAKINSNKCLTENVRILEQHGNIINSFIKTLTLSGYSDNKNRIPKFKYYKYKILSKILSGENGRQIYLEHFTIEKFENELKIIS